MDEYLDVLRSGINSLRLFLRRKMSEIRYNSLDRQSARFEHGLAVHSGRV